MVPFYNVNFSAIAFIHSEETPWLAKPFLLSVGWILFQIWLISVTIVWYEIPFTCIISIDFLFPEKLKMRRQIIQK